MQMNLQKESLAADSISDVHAWGQLLLRVGTGLMIFYIHGWHKLKDGVAYLRKGTRWALAEEVPGHEGNPPMEVRTQITTNAL